MISEYFRILNFQEEFFFPIFYNLKKVLKNEQIVRILNFVTEEKLNEAKVDRKTGKLNYIN